ncbi:MAG: DNA/RNA nuclease SfsA [Ruminococcus sp.]
MKYQNITQGEFIKRPNRFIAVVNIDGKEETVHVKNTGRCKELLVPKAKVYLEKSINPDRKTKYDLVAVLKEREKLPPLLVNLDSQIPNSAAEEWLKKGELFGANAIIKREVVYKNSRFDFYIEDKGKKCFLEVKGVTLEKDGAVLFPDAPTERGVKHINELMCALEEGYKAYILFVVQMKGVTCFMPNDETHREFGDALRAADKAGVKILALDCVVTPDSMTVDKPVKVDLYR